MNLLKSIPKAAKENDFNAALRIIQKSIGQPAGDIAGQYFADAIPNEDLDNYWLSLNFNYRKHIIADYVRYEIMRIPTDQNLPPAKEIFLFKDISGRGVSNQLTKEHLLNAAQELTHTSEEAQELTEYLESAEVGQEFFSNSFKLIRI